MILRLYLLFICLILSAGFVSTDNSYCKVGGGCSNEKLMSIIIDLQDEARQAERQVFENYQNCTACFSSPCLNGGSCIPEGNNYSCNCPYNTSGSNCETVIECRDNSCGQNATCFVANHQINCVCKLGYFGDDPYHAGCPLKVVQSCFWGDPHFITFDQLSYGYQGTCPFIVSEPCSSIPGYPSFSVRAVNTRWEKNAQ
uniref:Uncharacterized protein n=1 Tax=Plectus sambesii TaxID=2011161 RepID=A0A914VNA0_9BILA